MRTFQFRKSGVRLTLALILGFGLAANASAGTVYSWTTDGGTQSFSNDKKRIPSRYKDSAERRTVGSLASYDRFTPGPKTSGEDYSTRLANRLQDLRDRADRESEAASYKRHHPRRYGMKDGMMLDWRQNNRRGSSLGLAMPISRMGDGADGPMHVQDVRLPRQGTDMTTHHAKIVRRGGKIVAVFEAERNDNPLP